MQRDSDMTIEGLSFSTKCARPLPGLMALWDPRVVEHVVEVGPA